MTPFEKRLAELPLNPPPAEWRTTILEAARAEKTGSILVFPAWARRHPMALGALAASWTLIVFLNVAGPRDAELHSLAFEPAPTPSAERAAGYFASRHQLLRPADGTESGILLDRSRL